MQRHDGKQRKEWQWNLHGILGFQSEAAVFPVTDHNKGWHSKSAAGIRKILPESTGSTDTGGLCGSFRYGSSHARLRLRRVRGLETLFSKGRLLEDRDLDQIPDVMNLHFVIPEDAEDFVYEAACNLAFRYGMETTAYEGALIGDKEAKGEPDRI